MIIYPDNEKIDDFQIHLSKKELENLLEGIKLAPHPNSPWSLGTIRQITKALEDNTSYHSLSWDEKL